ncbi:hypothetical protein HDU86_001534 [Geranomyces michiganensis]|nr:hypothetical protein HDU86_001534 [Geranomyces michiganensis]
MASTATLPSLSPPPPKTADNASLETVAAWVHELPVASLDPSQYLAYASACYLATLHQCRVRNPLAGIDNLHAALRRIDQGVGLSDWFGRLPATTTPGDDDHDVLHAVLAPPARKSLDRIAAVAWIGLAIGRALLSDATATLERDKRLLGLHYHVAATYVFTALRRRARESAPASAAVAGVDGGSGRGTSVTRQYVAESQFRELYMYSTRLALALLPDTGDLAVELATKLVSIHDVAIAEAVGAASATGASARAAAGAANGSSSNNRRRSSTSSTSSTCTNCEVGSANLVDPEAHFAAQMALGGALLATNSLKPAYRAYSRALELLQVEWPFREPGKEIQPASSPQLLSLRLNLTTCAMAIERPAEESLNHARAALQLARRQQAAPSEIDTLLRAVGKLAYSYALHLAGGPDTASSPPVAIAHPGVDTKFPPARDLVCEASAVIQEALDNQKGKPGSRALALQVRITDKMWCLEEESW